MNNGIIILSAIVLLFLGMYVYSYSFEYFERLKEGKKLKKRALKDAMLNDQIALNQKVREEKIQKLSERSNEIEKELMRLEEFRNKLLNRQSEKKKHFESKLA